MATTQETSATSAKSACAEQKKNAALTPSATPSNSSDVLTDRWPALLNAMRDYKRKIADDFSALAYRCVSDGIIRLDDRRRLAKAAHRAGIRPFDAQILIACAIRQHTLNNQQKSRVAPPLTTRSPRRPLHLPWQCWALTLALAATLDTLLIWKWLS